MKDMKDFKVVKGYRKFVVSVHGQVWNNITHKEASYIRRGENAKVKLISDDGKSSEVMSVTWIVAMSFLEIPKHLEGMRRSQISIKHLDGDVNNKHPENLCYFHPSELEDESIQTRYKTKLLDDIESKGFKIIPGCERYAINKEGTEVLGLTKMSKVKIFLSDSQLPFVQIQRTHNGKYQPCFRKINWLVLCTWGKMPKEVLGNHRTKIRSIDGDPNNNHVENLKVI